MLLNDAGGRSRTRTGDGAMAKRTTKRDRAAASDPALQPATEASAVSDADIARRAYDLYLSRGCEHGYDLDDWLNAERELRGAQSAVAA